jgi:anthraniloyl-CoA monooxygenase
MKICVVGGGPGGLYFSILIKRRVPDAEVVVYERNSPEITFGWGVVFSGRTGETLLANDAESAERLMAEFVGWDTIETVLEDRSVTTNGHPFFGIDRRKLLSVLSDRCRELGVETVYGREILPGDQILNSYDLVVAADGVNSRFRSGLAPALGATERRGDNKYIWLGTKTVFNKFRFVFKRMGSHWIWAHAYPFDKHTSTFIVECSKSAWEENGFRQFATAGGCNKLAELFSDALEGQDLAMNGAQMRNASWDRFRQVECRRWTTGNIVLIGDAAHTIHFSIGSGTKQAFDDAICLADSLSEGVAIPAAIDTYQNKRMGELSELKAKGDRSMRWFEEAGSYAENLGVNDFERALLHRATCSAYEKDEVRSASIS